MNELLKVETLEPAVIFAEGGLDELLAEAKAIVKETPKDMDTAKGRKAIVSLATLVTKSKTGVQALAKEAKAPHQKAIDSINAGMKSWAADMDTLQKETRNPVTEFEQQDEKRKNALKLRMTGMENLADNPGSTPERMEEALANLKKLYENEWQEYSAMANDLYTASKDKIQVKLSNANIQIKKDKELDDLRAKQEESDAQALKDKEELDTLRAEKAEREAEKAQPEPEPVKEPEPPIGTPAVNVPAGALTPATAYPAGDSSPYDKQESKTEDGLADMAGATTPATAPPKQFANTLPESDTYHTDDGVYTIADSDGQRDRLVFGDVLADMYDEVHAVLVENVNMDAAGCGELTEKVVDAIEAKLKIVIDAHNKNN